MMMIEPLKKTLSLGRGETATSFACRVSTLWRAPTSTLFWEDVGIPFRSIVKGEETALRILATVTGANLEELMRNSPVWLDRVTYRIGKEVVLARDFVRGRARVCPACLQDDISGSPQLRPDQATYGRLAWQALPIGTCWKHGRSLVEVESDLPSHFGYHDFGLRIGHVVHDIAALRTRSIARPFSPFEQYYLDRLAGVPTNVPLLDGLRLHQVSAASLVFGCVSLFGPKRRQATLSEHEVYLARQEGFEILREGASAIGRLCNRLMVESTVRFTRSHTVTGTLGHIFDWLDRTARDDTELDRLRSIVAEQAFATFPMAGGEVLFGITNINPPKLTVHDVERRYGIDWITATRVATLAGVLSHLRSGDAPGPKVILAEDADRLFARFVDVVSITVLAHELGATQKQLMALVDAGYLKPAFERPDILMSFRRPDVDLFLNSVAARAVPTAERDPQMASIRRAAWRSAPKFLTLIKAIVEGRVPWLGQLPDGQLFQRLLMRREDVADLLGLPTRTDSGTLHQTELCEKWKVNSVAIADLVKRRILIADEVGSRGRRYRIRQDSAASFDRTYVSVKRLALQRGEKWASVKRVAERNGIRPEFPGVRGCFYRRDELRRANLI